MSTRAHGTNARAKLGPDENGIPGRGCRCTACRKARRDYENHRTRLIVYGRWQPYVPADRARQHVQALSEHGIGWKKAADLAGISTGTMSELLYGKRGRPPSRRIRPETEAAILAVRPVLHARGDRSRVDGTGTRRRLQALVACGWSGAKLAARLGMRQGNFWELMRSGRPVSAATARAVTALYDELWNIPPPQEEWHDKIAASRARNYARARGWVPPLAWDDDRIDDPEAAPAEGWRRPERRPTTHIVEEYAELARFGLSRGLAAERLGISRKTLNKILSRARGAA